MRAFFITLVLIAAIAGGGYYYWRENPEAFAPKAEPPAAPSPEAARPPPALQSCASLDASYEFSEDQRLRLRFRLIEPAQGPQVASIGGRQFGDLAFVVHVTSTNSDYVFTPQNAAVMGAPQYAAAATYLRPEAGGEPIQVSLFDANLRYIGQFPRHDSIAPAYVYAPDLMRALYQYEIDLPPGMFRISQCEPAPTPTAAETPTPAPAPAP